MLQKLFGGLIFLVFQVQNNFTENFKYLTK